MSRRSASLRFEAPHPSPTTHMCAQRYNQSQWRTDTFPRSLLSIQPCWLQFVNLRLRPVRSYASVGPWSGETQSLAFALAVRLRVAAVIKSGTGGSICAETCSAVPDTSVHAELTCTGVILRW